MDWSNPRAFLLAWLALAALALVVLADRWRDRGLRELVGSRMATRLAPRPGRGRRWLKRGLLAVALLATIAALARPRWGVFYVDVEARGIDVFVLVDTSRSMLAEDVRPSRLERAKTDVRDFLARVRGDRVGLIAFAGAAVVKCPLTLDHTFFELALADLDENSAPRGGTMIGDSLRVALRAFSSERGERTRLVLLLTDGDDQDSYPVDAAAAAAEQGVRIIAVGLGDAQSGALLPAADGGYMTEGGEHVRSRLDLRTLEDMTRLTGGVLVPAGTRDHDLGKVYDEHVAGLLGEEVTGKKRSRLHERYQWFAALALVALLADALIASVGSARTSEEVQT